MHFEKERQFSMSSLALPSIIEAIGHTPMVSLSRLVASRGLVGHLLAKVEFLTPGMSKKDRIAKQMVLDARADGELLPGMM